MNASGSPCCNATTMRLQNSPKSRATTFFSSAPPLCPRAKSPYPAQSQSCSRPRNPFQLFVPHPLSQSRPALPETPGRQNGAPSACTDRLPNRSSPVASDLTYFATASPSASQTPKDRSGSPRKPATASPANPQQRYGLDLRDLTEESEFLFWSIDTPTDVERRGHLPRSRPNQRLVRPRRNPAGARAGKQILPRPRLFAFCWASTTTTGSPSAEHIQPPSPASRSAPASRVRKDREKTCNA